MNTYFFYNLKNENNKIISSYKKKRFTHHIVSLTTRLENEIIIVDQIKYLIPDYDEYFYVFNTIERLKIAAIDEEMEHIESAKEIAVDSDLLQTYDYKKLIYADSYLKNLSTTSYKKYIMCLIDFYRSAINSITKLFVECIIHNNISLDTVIVDEEEETLLLSNFTFAIEIRREKLLKFFSDKSNISSRLPVEFHLLHYQIANDCSLSQDNIETVVSNYLSVNSLNTNSLNSYSYFSKYVNKSTDEIMSYMIKYADTWDNYALSSVFLSILRSSKRDNQFITDFMKLLEINMSLDPSKRGSLNNALNQFNELVFKTNFKNIVS
jgi:hypothetical protein